MKIVLLQKLESKKGTSRTDYTAKMSCFCLPMTNISTRICKTMDFEPLGVLFPRRGFDLGRSAGTKGIVRKGKFAS